MKRNPPTPQKPKKEPKKRVNSSSYKKDGDIKKRQMEGLRKARKAAQYNRKTGKSRMPRNPKSRSEMDIRLDMIKVSELLGQGYTNHEMAQMLGRTEAQVGRDVKKLFEEMAESTANNLEHYRQKLIAQASFIFKEARDAWFASKGDKESLETTARVYDVAVKGKAVAPNPKGGKALTAQRKADTTIMKVEGRDGDPRFLLTMDKCNERVQQLLGLDKTSPGQNPEDAFNAQADAFAAMKNMLDQLTPKAAQPIQPAEGPVESEPIDVKAETIQ